MPMPELTVARAPLVAACNRLRKLLPARTRKVTELCFTAEGDDLILEVQGGQEAVPAAGEWRGRAYVAGNTLMVLGRNLVAGDPLRFCVEGDRLVIHGEHAAFKVRLRWEDIGPAHRVALPLDASDLDVLVGAARMSDAEIVSSGLQRRIDQAEAQLIRRSEKAARQLESFGISAEDLRAFIRSRIRDRAAK
jgi:hypothetical protein